MNETKGRRQKVSVLSHSGPISYFIKNCHLISETFCDPPRMRRNPLYLLARFSTASSDFLETFASVQLQLQKYLMYFHR